MPEHRPAARVGDVAGRDPGPARWSRGSLGSVVQDAVRDGLDRDEFTCWYQPVVALADGQVQSYEAMLRWRHPEAGLLRAGHFLHLLSDDDLMARLGRVGLHRVVDFARSRRAGRGASPPVSLNLSCDQVLDTTFIRAVSASLADADLLGGRVSLEIQTPDSRRDAQAAVLALGELAQTGVPLVLDDYGRGVWSLGDLVHVPVDAVKIDAQLVAGLPHARESLAIIRALSALGRELGIRVVAKGVEDAAQASMLLEAGCQYGQGLYLGAPTPSPANAMTSANTGHGGWDAAAAARLAELNPRATAEPLPGRSRPAMGVGA